LNLKKSTVLLFWILAPSAWSEELILPVKTLSGHPGSVSSIAFSSDSGILVSAGQRGTINLWDMKDFHSMRTWKDHSDSVSSVFYSPDGAKLLSGSQDKTLLVRSATDYTILNKTSLDDGVSGLVQDPKFKTLAAVLGGRRVQFLNGESYKPFIPWRAPQWLFLPSPRWRPWPGTILKSRS
jgi:WD40 repeat protein